jgi:hypothetical protein
MTVKRPLANAILTLRLSIVDADGPMEFADLFNAIDEAVRSQTPEKVLNAKFGQLRRQRAGIFYRLNRWLNTPAIKATASQSGAHWAWRIWRLATVRLHKGKKASIAFGMNQNGRPQSNTFTRADDAAYYAVHMLQNGQTQSELAAIHHSATLYRARVDEVTKSIKFAHKLSSGDIALMVAHSKSKRV